MKIKKSLGIFVEINLVNDEGVTALVRNNQGQSFEVFYTLDALCEFIKDIPHLASKEQDK